VLNYIASSTDERVFKDFLISQIRFSFVQKGKRTKSKRNVMEVARRCYVTAAFAVFHLAAFKNNIRHLP